MDNSFGQEFLYSTLPPNFSNLEELKMRGLEIVRTPPNLFSSFPKRHPKKDNLTFSLYSTLPLSKQNINLSTIAFGFKPNRTLDQIPKE